MDDFWAADRAKKNSLALADDLMAEIRS